MTSDLTRLSATDLVAHYRARRLSPVEVTRAVLDRIEALNPVYNAFVVADPLSAMASARASEERWRRNQPAGAVDGVPTSVKDLVLARGWPTRRGSMTIDPNQPWDVDGPPVARLREQGAVLLGKTTTPEFGWKGVTDSPLTGITRNPWNLQKTPGGSSAGAASSVAGGVTPIALGTDGGGSLRIPGCLTGLAAIKGQFAASRCGRCRRPRRLPMSARWRARLRTRRCCSWPAPDMTSAIPTRSQGRRRTCSRPAGRT